MELETVSITYIEIVNTLALRYFIKYGKWCDNVILLATLLDD